MTVNDFLDLITSAFRDKPNFVATLTALVEIPVRVAGLMQSMPTLFDVDIAQGVQLDAVGEWVGLSRRVAVPIPGVYFSWDGTDYALGWDFGVWQPATAPTEITVLPDDIYRSFLKAKIAANRWDGTIEGAYAVWDQVFTQFTILIQDNQNMTYGLIIVGGIVDSLTLALLQQGYLPLRPEGVAISEFFVPIDDGPLFAWDTENSYLQGWNEGSWAREIFPT